MEGGRGEGREEGRKIKRKRKRYPAHLSRRRVPIMLSSMGQVPKLGTCPVDNKL